MSDNILHESRTPADTIFQVTGDLTMVRFVGDTPTSQGDFDIVRATPVQACDAAEAVLRQYRPEALKA